MGKEDRRESFLNDLGRATRRGVRECRKCGTLNGTRGYSCKNKSCDVVFKEAGEKKKLSTEACRIMTGDNSQIFSVRVRDKGPDYRGFVQLDSHDRDSLQKDSLANSVYDPPSHVSNSGYSSTSTINTSSIMDDFDGGSGGYVTGGGCVRVPSSLTDTALDCMKDTGLLLSSTHQPMVSSSLGRPRGNASAPTCYVDSCQKSSKGLVTAGKYSCSHIKAASHCFKNSQSVMLKSSVLNSMPIPPELKSAIWHLAIHSKAPLVQRVSKNIMVVKCDTDSQHPLGFLHFSFHSSRSCHRDGADLRKYFCSCRAFKTSTGLVRDVGCLRGRNALPLRSCIHLYSCLIALASHPEMAREFAHYIALISQEDAKPPNGELSSIVSSLEEDDEDDLTNTVKIQVTEEMDEDDNTTAYIRVSDPGSCGRDDEMVSAERSFLILNDGSDQQCQVEVEVLQDEGPDHLLQDDASDHLLQSDPLLREDDTDRFLEALDRHHRNSGRRCASSLVAEDGLAGKLEIQLHTSEDGGMELCTADGGSITVHPCVTSAHHHHHHHQEQRIATINRSDSSLLCNSNSLQSSDLPLSMTTSLHHSLGDTGFTTTLASQSPLASIDTASLQHKTGCAGALFSKRPEPAVSQAPSCLISLQSTNSDFNRKPAFGNAVHRKAREPVDETATSLPFRCWLAGAAERINQTMQYASPGRPPPLVFHVPLDFFVCLFERMQFHSRKKLAAVQTSTPHSDPSNPARQTRYTWNLFNLTHVKDIFSTSEVPLQVTRSFLLNRNGTYQYYQPSVEAQSLSTSRNSSQPYIKPQEYSTMLRVGPSTGQHNSKSTPFIIDWIPDVFPVSKIGELRVKFEYDHIHNGCIIKNPCYKDELSLTSVSNSMAPAVFQPSILINSATNNCSSALHSSSVKTSLTQKTSPPPIAPKITINSQLKESNFDEQSAAILGIALSHDGLDADSYSALLFS